MRFFGQSSWQPAASEEDKVEERDTCGPFAGDTHIILKPPQTCQQAAGTGTGTGFSV